MSLHVPQPSKKFLRAAVGERKDLLAHRARLAAERNRLAEEIRRIDASLTDVAMRVAALDQALGTSATTAESTHETTETSERHTEAMPPEVAAPGTEMISGPEIREAAVQALLRQPEYIEALHYRRWYELLCGDGYAVRGKDPVAVFLTQLTRSPVVRKSSQAGVYELDRQAPLRLRQRLERLRSEMRELSTSPTSDAELGETRARRHDLDVAIGQTERALEEALRVLRRDEAGSALDTPQRATG